jgi:hypothetical protein
MERNQTIANLLKYFGVSEKNISFDMGKLPVSAEWKKYVRDHPMESDKAALVLRRDDHGS